MSELTYLAKETAMSETWRRTVVGTVMVIIGLGLLEMALNRTPLDRPGSELTAPAGDASSPRRDYLDAEGQVLRVENATIVAPSLREISAR